MDPEKFGYYVNNLWSAFTLMDSKNDIRLLFKDLFTHTEYKMFAKRLEISRRLISGQTYEVIQRDTGVTSGTIMRINEILNVQGIGLRKANEKLDKLEEKYAKTHREQTKNRENPFRSKIKQNNQTLLGQIIKGSVQKLDTTISKKLKQQTASKKLSS